MDSREKAAQALKAHGKILLDVRQALALIGDIHDPGDSDQVRLANEARFTTAVVGYARSFTNSRGGIVYPIRELKAHPSFDVDVHEHLVSMRNKIMAHADEEAFPSDVVTYNVDILTDVFQTIAFSVVTVGHRFSHFRDGSFKARVMEHLKACLAVVDLAWDRDAGAFLAIMNSRENAAKNDQVEHPLWATSFNLASQGSVGVMGEPQPIPWVSSPRLEFSDSYKFQTTAFVKKLETMRIWLASGDTINFLLDAQLHFSGESAK